MVSAFLFFRRQSHVEVEIGLWGSGIGRSDGLFDVPSWVGQSWGCAAHGDGSCVGVDVGGDSARVAFCISDSSLTGDGREKPLEGREWHKETRIPRAGSRRI